MGGVYAPQQAGAVVISRSLKDVGGLTYVLALFLGGLGIHNFYLGRVGGVAVTQLVLTIVGIATTAVGSFGMLNVVVLVWVLVELFLIPGFVRAANDSIRYGR